MVISEFSCVQTGNQRVWSSPSVRPLPAAVQPSTLLTHRTLSDQQQRHTATNTADCYQCSVQQHFRNHIRTSLHYMRVPQVVSSNKQKKCIRILLAAEMAQLVQRLATGWTVRGSNPGGAPIFRLVQTGPEAHPSSCTKGTGSYRR